MLNRYIINKVRFVLEDVLPAFVRDSFAFYLLLKLAYRGRAQMMAQFRERATTMSDAELVDYYHQFPALLDTTDLNEACIKRIVSELVGETVIDVGCGRGWFLNHLSEKTDKKLTGVDFVIPDELRRKYPHLTLVDAAVEKMPFADKSFDTVVCSHTLEHVRDVAGTVADLRRICRHRLIIVVPSEREYKYSFNLHVNFFPYKHSLLGRLAPLPPTYKCEILDGDIFYMEDVQASAPSKA